MSKTAITSPELAPPVGPFSQAIEVGGFIYFSGQVGQDPTTGKLVAGGIATETERVFQNLSAVLKAAGKSFADVARAFVYAAAATARREGHVEILSQSSRRSELLADEISSVPGVPLRKHIHGRVQAGIPRYRWPIG